MFKVYTGGVVPKGGIIRAVADLCQLTSNLAEADFLLLPFGYEYTLASELFWTSAFGLTPEKVSQNAEIAGQLDNLSGQTGKKLLVFYYSDSSAELMLKNAIIFRTSVLKSIAKDNVFAMPAFLDFYPGNPTSVNRKWSRIPRVSFRGQSAPIRLPAISKLRLVLHQFFSMLGFPGVVNRYWLPAYILRRKALLQLLKHQDMLSVDWLITGSGKSLGYQDKVTYLQSLQDNDYIVCVAGWGNFSVRFFETLREGRIPVFINTDCLLPCEDEVDYQNLIVWIEEKNVKNTAQIINKFHQSLSHDNFEERQSELSNIYNKWLCYEGFSQYVVRKLLKSAKKE